MDEANRNSTMELLHFHAKMFILAMCAPEIIGPRKIISFVLPEGQKWNLGLTAQIPRAFSFCHTFSFSKRKSVYSILHLRP